MRPLVALRWTGSLWFLPVIFALGVYSSISELQFLTGYHVADLARMTYVVAIVGPLTATYCAFKFNGFVSAVDLLSPMRSGPRLVFLAWWPLIIGPPVAAVLSILVLSRRAWPAEAVGWQIVGLVAATILACALLGMALGRCLHVVFAVPIAATLTFWWLAFPQAGTNTTLRYLNASFAVCCTSAQVPSPLMVRASAIVAVTLSLGVILTWAFPRWSKIGRQFAITSVIAVISVAVIAGVTVIERAHEQPTLQAVAPRTTPKSCGAQPSVTVCVWPENVSRMPVLSEFTATLNAGLGLLGLSEIERVEEDPADEGTVGVAVTAYLSSRDIRYSLADGYARWLSHCVNPAGDAAPSPSAVAFFGRLAGLSDADIRDGFEPRAVTRSAEALDLAPEQTRAWVRAEIGTLALDCEA